MWSTRGRVPKRYTAPGVFYEIVPPSDSGINLPFFRSKMQTASVVRILLGGFSSIFSQHINGFLTGSAMAASSAGCRAWFARYFH